MDNVYRMSPECYNQYIFNPTFFCLGKEKSGLVDFDALMLTKNVVW
jgi:hypothetical protein